MDYCNIDNCRCSFRWLCILKKETSAMKEKEDGYSHNLATDLFVKR